jgi:hypothetical protein
MTIRYTTYEVNPDSIDEIYDRRDSYNYIYEAALEARYEDAEEEGAKTKLKEEHAECIGRFACGEGLCSRVSKC